MALELEGTLLGLGSMVRLDLESHSGLFVVLARGAYRSDPEQLVVVPRYLVGPHPYGEAPDQETFPVLAGEIAEVVFAGYTDDADDAFLADLLDQMEHGRRPTAPAEQFKDALTEVPERVEVAETAGDGAVGDPFGELRKVLGRSGQEVQR